MAVAWQATGTLQASTGADITPVNPSHLANDILLLVAWVRGTSALTTPSNWTLITSVTNGAGITVYWYWKRATTAAETNPLCDFGSATGDKYAVVHCIRGARKVGNPYQAFAAEQTTTDPDPLASVTTTEANSLIVFTAAVLDNLATGVTVTADVAPTTIAQRNYQTSATGSDGGCGIATDVKATAGAIVVTRDFTGGVPGIHGVAVFEFIEDTGGPATGPVKWQASGTLASSTGADITPVIPAHQGNDFLLLHAVSRGSDTCVTPAGWTLLGSNASPHRCYWFARIAMSGAETNPLCDWSAATDDKFAFVVVVRGALALVTHDEWTSTLTGGGASIDATVNSLLIHYGIDMNDAISDVNIATDGTPNPLTDRNFQTSTTGSDAACWTAADIMTALPTPVTTTLTFTGTPSNWTFGLAFFTALATVTAAADAILNLAPYQAHGTRW